MNRKDFLKNVGLTGIVMSISASKIFTENTYSMPVKLNIEGKKYQTGILAFADWVAGKNFDGFLYRESLIFDDKDDKVIWFRKIIDHSKYDPSHQINDSEFPGRFELTGYNTISCYFEDFFILGKFIGKNNEFIACSIHNPKISCPHSLCFELQQ